MTQPFTFNDPLGREIFARPTASFKGPIGGNYWDFFASSKNSFNEFKVRFFEKDGVTKKQIASRYINGGFLNVYAP